MNTLCIWSVNLLSNPNGDSYRFCVILFGRYVRELKEFMSSGDTSNAVIVLLWCKVANYNGMCSTTYSQCVTYYIGMNGFR